MKIPEAAHFDGKDSNLKDKIEKGVIIMRKAFINRKIHRVLVFIVMLIALSAVSGWGGEESLSIKIDVEDVQATNPITDGAYWVPFYATPTS